MCVLCGQYGQLPIHRGCQENALDVTKYMVEKDAKLLWAKDNVSRGGARGGGGRGDGARGGGEMGAMGSHAVTRGFPRGPYDGEW